MSRSVLETGVRVLRAVPAHGGRGQIAAIARALDIPYPTVHRTLVRLHRLGLVAKPTPATSWATGSSIWPDGRNPTKVCAPRLCP